MRQAIIVYGLILAVLLAALGLSYVNFRQSQQLAQSKRERDLRPMRELANEKILNIQTDMGRADTDLFDRVRLDELGELESILKKSWASSVVVLDVDRSVVADGSYTGDPDTKAFMDLMLKRVVPEMALDRVGINDVLYLHRIYDGRPYLFAYTKKFVDGRIFYVLAEEDLGYLIARIFPGYFDIPSYYIYQVVDDRGELIYGFPFTAPEQVEVPFKDLSSWRLRVLPKDAPSISTAESRQRTIDLLRIGTLFVIVAGALSVVVLAVRRVRRVSQMKSEFISNVSHELKTPLSIITMFGELLAMGRTKSPEQAREYADIIRRESVRLSRLIDTVLDFSKIERGIDVYDFAEAQELPEAVVRAIDISRHRLERAGMQLEVDLAADIPPIRMDGNAMTLAVLNLIDNALKYAEGGKFLSVALRQKGESLELEVVDRGPGVPPDEWHAVFDRFYRSRTVRLKSVRGSGIGLALVKHVAEAHGGGVSVDRGEGGGARFRLWIPAGGRA